jgi:hypothetical protein
LEIAGSLATVVAAVGTLLWSWSMNLITLLIILVVAYAALRDLRSLWLSKSRD